MLRLYTSDDYLAGRKPTCTRDDVFEENKFEVLYKKSWDSMVVIFDDGSCYNTTLKGEYYDDNRRDEDLDLMIDIPYNQ
jgi:hypothetical protein